MRGKLSEKKKYEKEKKRRRRRKRKKKRGTKSKREEKEKKKIEKKRKKVPGKSKNSFCILLTFSEPFVLDGRRIHSEESGPTLYDE